MPVEEFVRIDSIKETIATFAPGFANTARERVYDGSGDLSGRTSWAKERQQRGGAILPIKILDIQRQSKGT
jgi:hypothetical protein